MREITIQLSDDDADLIAGRTELVNDTLAGSATGRAMQAIQAELKTEEEPTEPAWEPQIGNIVKPNYDCASWHHGVVIGPVESGWAFAGFHADGEVYNGIDVLHWEETAYLDFVARPRTR